MARLVRLGMLVALLALAAAARAQEGEAPVSFHGFGAAAWGKTDGNDYLVGNHAGDYSHGDFALTAIAHPIERLQISAQIFLDAANGSTETGLDFAFAEWTVSDALKLRLGKAKQPFGIYAEIFDVGTLRPFYGLPQGVYGPTGLVAEGFTGVGIGGRRSLGAGGWAVRYDAYFGGLPGELHVGETGTGAEAGAEEGTSIVLNETVGGRVVLETSVRGLSLGASGYTGTENVATTTDAGHDYRRWAAGAQVEYLEGPWSLRSEYVHAHEADDDTAIDAFYVEAARHLGSHWQLAVRYDRSDSREADESETRDALLHRDLVVGLNYWFNPGLVLKVAYHRVEGNRFATPAAGEDVPKLRTDLIEVGAQFSF